MRRNDKLRWASGILLGLPLLGMATVADGRTVVSNRVVKVGPVVIVEPLLLPRVGSNDYLYTYDNIYGSGASAAGRMSHVVVNPAPQFFYPRQPRVYLGY